MRKVEPVGDVDKNGGTTRGDAPAGDEGEVTKAETELGIRARKAAALTVGEAMVAAGGFAINA